MSRRRRREEAARVADDAIRVTEHLPQSSQDAQVYAIFDILNRQLYARLLREAAMHPNQTPERPSLRKLRELLQRQGMAEGTARGHAEGRASRPLVDRHPRALSELVAAMLVMADTDGRRRSLRQVILRLPKEESIHGELGLQAG